MVTISLCMIVKNEEDTLERCLKSVEGFVDEIIIVDTGSTDRTKEIAYGFTDKLYDFAWIDDFSAARNFSYEQATMDYIMWLDADDIILPSDAAKFAELKKTLTKETDAVMIKYNTGFDSNGEVVFSCYRERLSRRACNFVWREPVHEHLDISGNRLTSDICVTHAKPSARQGNRNIRIYESYLSSGKELSPRGMYYYARELKDHGRYADAIAWFNKFLDSEKGWIEDNIFACGEAAKCYLEENRLNEALTYMLRSFRYDSPRAEICCQLGYFFKELRRYRQAVFWFELILSLDKDANNWGFRRDDCRGYIPCIELAVCYDKLGEYEKAFEFNEKAAVYRPDCKAVAHNRKYFENRIAR